MHTIKLRVSEKVYDHFLWFLKKFSKDEVEIIEEERAFYETRDYLEKELTEIKEGKARFSSLEDADQRLEKTIRKQEDPS